MASSFNTRNVVNDENSFLDAKKAQTSVQNSFQECRRIALTTISENLPKKANEKGVTKSEIGKCVQTSYEQVVPPKLKQNFTIFEDNSLSTTIEVEPELVCDLPENVTKLYKHEVVSLLPSSFIAEEYEISTDSPMVLDLSHDTSRVSSEGIFQMEDYDEDIYKYLRSFETKFRPSPAYMRKQSDITASMRAVLVDWIVDVCESYKMETATLYNAVAYTDRFLSHMSVLRGKLQLVGTACLFVASKYEEIYPPELKEFVYVTDDTYTKKQILRMEQLILKVLGFNLSAPTAYEFVQRYCLKCSVTEEMHSLALYICEMSLLQCDPFLSYLPSIVAAASLCLAIYTMGNLDPWTSMHEEITGHSLDNIEQCVKDLVEVYSSLAASPYRAITEKYSSTKYHCVAKLPPPHLIRSDSDDDNEMKST